MVHDALAVPRAARIGLEDRGSMGLVPATLVGQRQRGSPQKITTAMLEQLSGFPVSQMK
jgi:hypothetical protein